MSSWICGDYLVVENRRHNPIIYKHCHFWSNPSEFINEKSKKKKCRGPYWHLTPVKMALYKVLRGVEHVYKSKFTLRWKITKKNQRSIVYNQDRMAFGSVPLSTFKWCCCTSNSVTPEFSSWTSIVTHHICLPDYAYQFITTEILTNQTH